MTYTNRHYPPEDKHQFLKDMCALITLCAFFFGFIVLVDRISS